MSINVSVGTRVPAYATSMGRVLLAWADPEHVSRYLDETVLRALTPATVTSPEGLRACLSQVREQGWALVDGELESGLISASAPVRDRSGAVVAALASSSSAGRVTLQQMETTTVPLLLRTAEAISAELGHGGRP